MIRLNGADVFVLADNEAEAFAAFAIAAPWQGSMPTLALTTIRRDHPEAGRYRDVTPHPGQWRVRFTYRGKTYREVVTGYSLGTADGPSRKRINILNIECLRLPRPREATE